MTAAIKKPGWIRALFGTIVAGAFGFGLVVALRAISGLEIFQTEQTGYPHLIVPAITAPFGFLIGFGAFDYWFRWAAGKPTIPEDHSGHGATSWKDYFKFNTDHKVIGIQYIVTTMFFFFVGGLLAMLIRAELAQPGTQIVDAGTYNGLFSTHAVLMIFLFIIPVFAGIANYVLPLMIGAPDMAFPRLNALSFWMLPLAGILFLTSYFVPGGAFDAGWTGYAPLSTGAPLGQSFFNIGVQFAGASSIATALNFLVTIITMRAPGMNFWRMPLLVWANLSTSLLVVAATPFIAGAQFMVLFDRVLHTNFFQFAEGGDVVSYQHIFWFYSHPAVYIMVLPGFGIISEVISTHSRKPIFGYRLMALALIGIVVLSYSVWAHHMFVAGMFSWLRVPMMITTLLIAVPTGIKIFSWLGTLFYGKIHTYSTAMLFSLAFIVTFTIGGISGVMLGMVPIDIHVSDTYFIVAHIHFVLFGGSVFTIFAGIYHWYPKMTGRMYDERLGRVHFWGTLVGTWGTFIPMHWIGMDGMPRRVADYAEQYGDWNLLISVFAFTLGAAQLVFLYNMIVSWRHGPRAGANPWRAKTIEWQVSSPPPIFNFDEIPRVVGGPYEFGVPGAQHAIMTKDGADVAAPEPAVAGEKMTERPEDEAERPEEETERPSDDAAAAAELNEPDSPGAQPDATDATAAPEERTAEGGPQPEEGRQEPVESAQPQSVASPDTESAAEPEPESAAGPETSDVGADFNPDGKPLLVFLNEVAGGRKLLQTVRDRVPQVSEIAVVSPQNQPAIGAKIARPELYEAALSRVEVTMSVLAEFGLDSVGDVMDTDSMLALDDAVRAFEPGEVLLSALPDTRLGLMRKDLVEWARRAVEPEVTLTHIPVRVADDSVRWDVTHTLVVATKTVNKRELVDHLLGLAKEQAHRFTFICPRSEGVSREDVSRDLAATLAEMYRADIDATGQPMSPEPFLAVQNAVENYRIDEILISTLSGQQSKWLDEGLIEKVRDITEKPVIHIEGGKVVDDGQAAIREAEERRDPVGAGERS